MCDYNNGFAGAFRFVGKSNKDIFHFGADVDDSCSSFLSKVALSSLNAIAKVDYVMVTEKVSSN